MVEAFVYGLQGDLLPSAGVVTGLATLWEAAMVRIFVTIGTLIERDAHVLRLAIGTVRMTLRALHLRMQSS